MGHCSKRARRVTGADTKIVWVSPEFLTEERDHRREGQRQLHANLDVFDRRGRRNSLASSARAQAKGLKNARSKHHPRDAGMAGRAPRREAAAACGSLVREGNGAAGEVEVQEHIDPRGTNMCALTGSGLRCDDNEPINPVLPLIDGGPVSSINQPSTSNLKVPTTEPGHIGLTAQLSMANSHNVCGKPLVVQFRNIFDSNSAVHWR